MIRKIYHLLKSFVSVVLTLIVVSTVFDFIRKPTAPINATTTKLTDLQNQSFFLAQLSQTQPTILYFWGSWCGYCQYTSPIIHSLAEEGYPVVSVALSSGDNETVQRYLTKHNYHLTTINDPQGTLSQQWQVSVTPTIIILDKDDMEFATTGLTTYWGMKVRLLLAKFF
ncbi:protein disulfide oxidoreductase [Pasteurella canis]|uniref:protein disulfide oxidoreductase n=1 Tax=Pasteurella canis TaxID=753 RepID=UPI001D10B77A|nr:protein disulfide oxidoreductase [Pasteurella canis]UDW83643.1 protein disulfide oxidoreductase [Pasteurella canis]